MPRKRRSDRNHLLYQITNTVTNETYIGITVVRGQAIVKSLNIRWEGHLYKAFVEQKDWTLPANIREYGPEVFTKEVIAVVRGKADAHKQEAQLINTRRPVLNTKRQNYEKG